MRILGGIIFLLGSVGMGLFQSLSYDRGIGALRQAADMMRYLISQIEIENASLPESICKVSFRMDGFSGKFYKISGKGTIKMTGNRYLRSGRRK